MTRLGKLEGTRHLYELGTDKGRIEVLANSSAQARKLAERAGFVVRDVNMTG